MVATVPSAGRHMTQDSYLAFAAMIAAAGGIALALNLIWRFIVVPIYRFLKAVSEFGEAQPVLVGIAAEFRTNNGASLRDQVDTLNGGMGDVNIRLENIEGQMEILVQAVGVWNGDERRQDA